MYSLSMANYLHISNKNNNSLPNSKTILCQTERWFAKPTVVSCILKKRIENSLIQTLNKNSNTYFEIDFSYQLKTLFEHYYFAI